MPNSITTHYYEGQFLLPYRSEYLIHQQVWKMVASPNIKKRNFVYRVDKVGDNALIRFRTHDKNTGKEVKARKHTVNLSVGDSFKFDLRCVPERRVNGRVIDTPRDDDAQDWLAERAHNCGFDLVKVDYAVSEPLVFRGKHNRRITLNDTVMTGILTVTDPDVFSRTLTIGVGRHKGFGFGFIAITDC